MSMSAVLSGILQGKNNFCCLCFQKLSETTIHFDDEIIIDTQDSKPMSQILSSIFRDDLNTIFTFEVLCNQCSVLSVNCYKFMKMCKDNCLNLSKAIDVVNESSENTITELNGYKTLFIALDVHDFTTKQFYDDTHLNSTSKAYQRIHSMIKTNIKEKTVKTNHIIMKTEFNTEKRKKEMSTSKKAPVVYDIPSIPTQDLVANSKIPTNYECRHCSKKFPQEMKLRHHYFKKHFPKNVKCPKCPRSFITEKLLAYHTEAHHGGGTCTECGKYFTSKYVLRKHEMNHRVKIICQECGRIYRSKEAFKKHITDDVCRQKMKKSSDQGDYQCDFCKKRYCHKPYLAKHIKYEHGNAEGFRCRFCSKQFYTQSRLETHLVRHTQEKKFVCPICVGRFVTKSSLMYHTRLHTGERPYQCEHCDKAFLSASRRLDHVRRHHLAPSLECDICHTKFKASGSLLKHRKRHFNPNSRLCTNRRFCPSEPDVNSQLPRKLQEVK